VSCLCTQISCCLKWPTANYLWCSCDGFWHSHSAYVPCDGKPIFFSFVFTVGARMVMERVGSKCFHTKAWRRGSYSERHFHWKLFGCICRLLKTSVDSWKQASTLESRRRFLKTGVDSWKEASTVEKRHRLLKTGVGSWKQASSENRRRLLKSGVKQVSTLKNRSRLFKQVSTLWNRCRLLKTGVPATGHNRGCEHMQHTGTDMQIDMTTCKRWMHTTV
jgi:hypothetical protein